MTDVGLGLPKSQWHTDEYQRRIEHRYEFRAESSEVVLIYPDGKTRKLSVSLVRSTSILESRSGLLANETVDLADGLISGFCRRSQKGDGVKG
jgi:hypothetical protein